MVGEECLDLKEDFILILDFGGQYGHLIARRIREAGYPALHIPVEAFSIEYLESMLTRARAVILSGGPSSVWESKHDDIALKVISLNKPVLGICYGHQLLAKILGGEVGASPEPEFGPSIVEIISEHYLFEGLPRRFRAWFSHNDAVLTPPSHSRVLAVSPGSPVAAFSYSNSEEVEFIGLQWHPEVVHSMYGLEILSKWADRTGVEKRWTVENMLSCIEEYTIELLGKLPKGRPIVSAVSGGVDSTVATVVVGRIASKLGFRVVPVIIDHGLHPSGELENAVQLLRDLGYNPIVARDASRFFSGLQGVRDPEEKRRIVSRLYFEVLMEILEKTNASALIQGTIYPDIIESGKIPGSDRIKSHHNVAFSSILPSNITIIEPLSFLYKDEVRRIGKYLGIKDYILYKQPIPGPGLAVRIEGEVTPEKVDLIRKADSIVRDVIEKHGLQKSLWQYFAILTASRATGVKGDRRAYGSVIVVRIVESRDAMTASVARLDWNILEEIAARISRLPGVTRVVYDISSKPPATIEWE